MQADPLRSSTVDKWLYLFIGLAALVNFSGLFVPLMDPDAGVYASVTRNMVEKNDYLNLYFQDNDWLDKPHFPFWITALFFKLFGMHDCSYKLPGIFFVLLAALYTYLFCRRYYNKTIGLWAVWILLTAEHILISNNDVRAEPFLTGMIIGAIYHFSKSFKKPLNGHLVMGCLFSALALMTKGLFTLFPIGAAVAGELVFTRNWKQLFHWRWLVALFLVALFITPELYALWYQFDQHPEKELYGRTGVSGIKFFLWDSQFGRFMNTGPIKGKGDPFFFIHTLLWAFFPWALLMYTSLLKKVRSLIMKRTEQGGEWFTISGSLLTILVFSFSRFQLPYYTNILFPLLAVLTARFVYECIRSRNKFFGVTQTVIAFIIPVMGIGLFIFYNPVMPPVFLGVLLILLLLGLIFLPYVARVDRSAIPYLRSGLAILVFNAFLNLVFYPDLLQYQSGNQVAHYANKNHPGEPIGRIGFYMPSGEFYLQTHMLRTDTGLIKSGKFGAGYLFVTADELQQLRVAGIEYNVVKFFPEFHVTMLTLKFLNPATREKELKKNYLVRLPGKK
jgi:4-amino-4-deoxy-L-arabinose transferase-like glycosyltransferase